MNKKTYQIIYGIVIILIFGILGASSVLGERKYKKKKNYSKSFYKKKNLRRSYYVPRLRNLPEGQVVDSKITHVEVYPSGALIERVGTVNLDSGEHRLVIPGLPNAIQAKSLYISGFSKDATAGSTFLESGTLVEFRPAELVKLEGELQALEEEEMELASLEAALKSRKELMMLNFSKVDQQLLSNLVEFSKLLDFSQNETLSIDKELSKIWSKRRDLKPKLEALQQQYNALTSKLQRSVKHIVVEVTVRKPVSIPLVLQYYVAGPTWEPRHVARYDSNAGKIVLETYAWVSQDTGEAWSEVKLKVSTVRSLRGLIPPIPSPMEVSLEKSKTHIAGQENQLQELPSRGYRLQEGDSRSFDIDGKVSIEFGKNGKKVLLKSRILKAIPERIATPAASPEVYLNLTIQNPGLIPFLPGKTSLFNGSDYIGTSQMPRLLPGELLIIPFGQDSSVRVERTLTERSQTKKKRKQSIRVNYNFKATNLKKQPIVVKVRDRSPHTKNKAIKIKLDDSKIPVRKRKKTDPRGQVTWIVEVPGSGQKLWNFSYTIIAPQGKRLVGLD